MGRSRDELRLAIVTLLLLYYLNQWWQSCAMPCGVYATVSKHLELGYGEVVTWDTYFIARSDMAPSELMQMSMEFIDQSFDPNLANLSAETW